jgi:hypothetical protein
MRPYLNPNTCPPDHAASAGLDFFFISQRRISSVGTQGLKSWRLDHHRTWCITGRLDATWFVAFLNGMLRLLANCIRIGRPISRWCSSAHEFRQRLINQCLLSLFLGTLSVPHWSSRSVHDGAVGHPAGGDDIFLHSAQQVITWSRNPKGFSSRTLGVCTYEICVMEHKRKSYLRGGTRQDFRLTNRYTILLNCDGLTCELVIILYISAVACRERGA